MARAHAEAIASAIGSTRERVATRADLEPLATKAELEPLATKAELAALETRLTNRFYGIAVALAGVVIASANLFQARPRGLLAGCRLSPAGDGRGKRLGPGCPSCRKAAMKSTMSRTWLLSGVPRSGTSLCCRLAGELPDTVALSEPIRRKAFGGMDTRQGACARIGDFADQARAQILAERRASSVQVDGRLDDNRTASRQTDAGLRRLRSEWGEIAIDKPLSADFTLLIKHNALFAALLPGLTKSFSCLALVRNPLLVLASWQTVDLPVHRGRIPAGEELDRDLHQALEREPEMLGRQLIVLDWFFGQFHAYVDPQDILRYEDVVESGGRALFRRLGHAGAQPAALMSRNDSALYDDAMIDTLLARLLDTGGHWTRFYSREDCERVAERIRRR